MTLDLLAKFINDHFSQLLLFTILLVFLFLIWHMESINDMSNVNWAREQATLILGAIVGPIAQAQISKMIKPSNTDSIQQPKGES